MPAPGPLQELRAFLETPLPCPYDLTAMADRQQAVDRCRRQLDELYPRNYVPWPMCEFGRLSWRIGLPLLEGGIFRETLTAFEALPYEEHQGLQEIAFETARYDLAAALANTLNLGQAQESTGFFN